MAAITLTDIHKSFGETRALAGASLRAEAGEIHAIVGENGSGKSTLAKIVSGVISPDRGTVDVLGGAPPGPAQAIAVGISTIYQEMMLAEALSVWENIFAGADGLWRRRVATAEKRARSRTLLSRLACADVDPDTPVALLPLNVKQWIVIARALVQRPRLLVFDESSAALDLEATKRLHGEMLALRDAGSCVLLVTHRIAELVRIADGATVLRDGATVGRLRSEEITEDSVLALMSAQTRQPAQASAGGTVPGIARTPALMAKAVTLARGAAPIDFSVHTGEIVGIAGLDGAGQAEFVEVLAGIAPPHSGSLSAGKAPIGDLCAAEAAGIVYVSGDRKREGAFPNLSILENFGLALHGRHTGRSGLIDRKAIRAAFDREAARLKIRFGAPGDKIVTLSGGNQQKVLIARAFALSPRIIVLKDPARGVDIGTKQELYAHLHNFAAGGGAVVYLSSEIEEFLGFASRVDVFVNNAVFASLGPGQIDEDTMLAAMFGRHAPVAFDAAAPHARGTA